MDTEWFAVDATGAVAVFDTGEDGALPLAAATGSGPETGTVNPLMLGAVLISRRIDRGDLVQTATEIEELASSWSLPANLVIAMREPPGAYRDEPRPEVDCEELLPEARFVIFQEKRPRIGLSREPLAPAKIRALVKTGLVVALVPEDVLHEILDEEAENDLFRYGRDHGDEPGAYVRRRAPARPLAIDDLPVAARSELGMLRLDVGFADTEQLHLADHMGDEEASYYGDWTLRGFGPVKEPGAIPLAMVSPARSRAIIYLVLLATLAAIVWAISGR
jgi:hypothetical protein